jgi:hypothetical protein
MRTVVTQPPIRHSARRVRLGLVPLLAGLLALLVAAGPAFGAFGWTGPTPIGTVTGCVGVASALDAGSARHVVAECEGNVRYLTDAGGDWELTTFSHPDQRVDVAPRIAVEEDVIYVAYTRLIAESDAPPIGIYYRRKTIEGATWSTTQRLGDSGDRLDDFVVVAGTIHATITSRGGDIFYLRGTPDSLVRYRLPGASGRAAVRVGDDGASRFVYETATLLRYAVFHGTGFDWSSIPGTDAGSLGPSLVLDGDSKAHVSWTHVRLPDVSPSSGTDGVFYATNASGEWTPAADRRVTGGAGRSSLALDPISGAVHILVGGSTGLRYYTLAATGRWTPLTLSALSVSDVHALVDVPGERVVVVASQIAPDFAAGGLFSMTKP